MSDKINNTPVTRDELRAALLGKKQGKSEMVTLFGQEIELRQPSLASILDAREDEDPTSRAITMIINYAYVPGTDEKVFEPGDISVMLQWPFNEDLIEVQNAIMRLTGIEIGDISEALEADPLEGPQ